MPAPSNPILILVQLVLIITAIALGHLASVSKVGSLGIALLGGCLLLVISKPDERSGHLAIVGAWLLTPLALAFLPLSRTNIDALDRYHSFLVWLIGAAIGLSLFRVKTVRPRRWTKILAMTWALCGALVWISASYLKNHTIPFFIGLAILLAMLILLKFWFKLSTLAAQIINLAILLVIGLPLGDLFVRAPSRIDPQTALNRQLYSYQVARQEPTAFASWWKCYLEQWDQMMGSVIMLDPEGILPFKLKPNAVGLLFESRISINSLGFRGDDFSLDKGDAYRIVVLGESTTFGCTLRAADKPWTDVLADLIRERLATSRPVQVINAGVPAYNLKQNVGRLEKEILPLKPDLIISYHGANGFRLLDEALPPPISALPAPYRHRPLKLLADCEYRLKMILYRRGMNPQRLLDPGNFSNPLKTKYADSYRDLITIAKTNHIRLVLANYAMAVNSQSDSDIVQFYRIASPPIHWQIRANAVHTEILRQLAATHPEVCLVNTHPRLDGDPDNFIDMAHMTQKGRQQMAENMFTGIKDLLLRDLTPTPIE